MEAAPLRYAGVATLLRRPLVNDPSGVDIALIGVPYDGATENRPGTRHGPREIRNMSSFTRSIHHVTRVNPYELCNVADLGDVNFSNPFGLIQCFADITDFYRKICAAGAVPLSVGGDHSISFPILRAVAAEQPVGMIHLDAHTDTNDTELRYKFTHGTPFRRAMEEDLLDPKRTIQIGIRGAQNSEESWQGSEDAGIRVMYMEEFTSLGIEATLNEVRNVVGQEPAYISFDISYPYCIIFIIGPQQIHHFFIFKDQQIVFESLHSIKPNPTHTTLISIIPAIPANSPMTGLKCIGDQLTH